MVSPSSGPAEDPQEVSGEGARDEGDGGDEPQEPLIDRVQKRVEELLGKQNLSEDAYILQNMNAQMYITLNILATHHSLCILGEEADVISSIRDAAHRSEKFGLDEEGQMVRPLFQPRRNTLILRDLPEVYPEDELKDLFGSSPESESFCSIKPDVNNTAFVSFKTDEAAQNVALWLRSQKLQGAEIKCAIKSEHFVRSFFPASPGPSMQANPYMPQQAWGYQPPWMSVQGAWSPGESFDPNMGWNWGSDADFAKGDGKGKKGKGKGKGKGEGKEKGRSRGALGGSFGGSSQDMQTESGSEFSPQMQPGMVEGLAEPGYEHEYRKYSRQYVIEVCNAMEDIVKPESYEKCEERGVDLFRSTPCKDWAPLPTPIIPFASNFFDNERRGSDAQESDMGPRTSEKAGRKASWGPKGTRPSRSESHDYEESGQWTRGDHVWWQSSDAGADSKRSYKQSWDYGSDGKSWDYGKTDGGYEQQKWVKKDEASAQAADQEETTPTGKPRTMSWADKVRGVAEPSGAPQRWVAKAKPADESSSKGEKDSEVNQATDAESAPAAPTGVVAPGADKATPVAAEVDSKATVETSAGEPAPLSWADKARAAANK